MSVSKEEKWQQEGEVVVKEGKGENISNTDSITDRSMEKRVKKKKIWR